MGTGAAQQDARHQTPAAAAAQAAHQEAALGLKQISLLNRLTWGATPALAKHLQEVGDKAFIDEQLEPGPAKLPSAVQRAIDTLPVSKDPQALVLRIRRRQIDMSKTQGTRMEEKEREEFQAWILDFQRQAQQRTLFRAVYSSNQLQEKMTWFWMNHFSVFIGKGPIMRPLIVDYEERVVHPRALGKFQDLLAATMRHPAMLVYLDNRFNYAKKINENYGRELMELHTLGVDAGYTQKDVIALSHILTGLGVNLTGKQPKLPKKHKDDYVHEGLFEFNPARHDYGDKQFLGHTIHGKGLAEIDEVAKLLAHQPATAKHISKKLAVYFVSDDPPEALIDHMSKVFLDSDGDIAATLRAMFESQAFQQALSKEDFKDPMRYVMASVRMMHGEGDPIVNAQPIVGWLGQLGEVPYGRVTPDGYPLERSDWQGSGQMQTRFVIARGIGSPAAGLYEKPEKGKKPATRKPPEEARKAYAGILRNGVSKATRQALQQANSLAEWNTLLLSSPDFMNH
ncbi:DUF1800 domain-containing protein [Allopusillimonas soli]|nr:DUF1800 domain-containing protein [Allopusillimonas soli]